MNDLFLKALHCENKGPRPPVWLMRQAGRYMPSYRALREKYSFMEMCHHVDLIEEITHLPINAFGFDAAILFSDILMIAEALGVGLHFEEGVGPIIERPLRTQQEVAHLPPPDMGKLQFVSEGIKRLKKSLKVPLIGFCGAPFTVASYMIEGKSSRDLKRTKQWMYSDEESFHQLLSIIANWSIAYLQMQADAGVDAIQIFDSWANYLDHSSFCTFSLAYQKKILDGIAAKKVPTILYCRGSSVFAPLMAGIGPQGISLDWNCRLKDMRNVVPSSIALQGNLDPDVLLAPEKKIRLATRALLEDMRGDAGFIFNLGHGITPDVQEASVKILVECIKEFR